uniref:DNA-directed RNA polymerase n=2 Tax=root TaxID=1 RepID=A0A481YXI1_9VIRU|nr:MAG: DNA-directed RNA polymerase subunit alpha [Marseillevirus LCMAC202]
MATLEWASDSEEDETIVNVDEPRKLQSEEIENIVVGLRFAVIHTPVQENSIYIHHEKTRRKLAQISIKPSKIPELKKTILQQFYSSVIAPGEAVGVNAAQCIGEPTTQSTLNSVAPNERLIIQEHDGTTRLVTIGNWIDALLVCNESKVQYIPKNRTEYLELPSSVWNPTPTKSGKINWSKVTAVTRHLPVGDLVRITSRSGRQVTVTKSKSLLVWNGGELVQKGGGEVKIGDLVPVIADFPDAPIQTTHLDLRKILSPNLTCVKSRIPEKFPLDEEFGRIVGLYLAEGWATNTFVGISNNDPTILQLVKDWCDKYSITYHVVVTKSKRFENSTSTDLKIHSVLIARWFKKWLGTGSENKFIPQEAYTAPIAFARGILDGYFAGDGTINKRDGYLVVSSASKDLITGFGVLCSRFVIVGKQSGYQPTKNNIGSMNIKYVHTYSIRNAFATMWAQKIGSCHPEKAELLRKNVTGRCFKRPYGRYWSKQEDAILDPIVNIETIPATEFVYDLTVPDTTTFSIWNGLGIYDTFHSAGITAKNVTLGFPRARELFNATKSPSNPTCTIYFTRDNAAPEELHKVVDKFPEANIEDLLVTWQVFEPDEYQLEYWHTAWFKLKLDFGEITEDDWCLRLQFDVGKLYEHDVTVQDIATRLIGTYADVRCIPSPLNLGIIDILVCCVDINISGARTNELAEITDDYKAREFYMNKIVSPKVRGKVICGISGITQIYRRKAKCDESFGEFPLKPEIANRLQTDEEWIVDTDGTNLAEILTQPTVDSSRTLSNDMWELSNIFGIEAARAYLYLEFMNIVNSGGATINPVHIQVLVDKMTYTGSIRAIARFGVETSQYDPIARATFEEVMTQIQTSAMFSEKDNLNGISSNIVLGTKINAGTGRIEFQDIPLKVVRPPNRTLRKSSKHASTNSSNTLVGTPGRAKIRPPAHQTIQVTESTKIVTEDI